MHNFRRGLLAVAGILLSASMLMAQESTPEKKSLLPDYKQKIGFTYGAGADLVSNYIWRGLYVGGLGVQADFNVGYGGLFLDMWWNLGAGDWTFRNEYGNTRMAFNPEVDLTLGFSRWGLTVMFMQMYYFDYYRDATGQLTTRSRFFDYDNHWKGGGGATQEWRIKYRVSDALPISILWCTRTWGRDGYLVGADNEAVSSAEYFAMTPADQEKVTLKRAYSSYLELGYDFYLPYNLCLEARLGMTPWKSMYTGFAGDFAVCNVSAKLNWAKDLSDHCRMTAFANLMLNPYDMATNYSINGIGNPFLWNIGCGFWLK